MLPCTPMYLASSHSCTILTAAIEERNIIHSKQCWNKRIDTAYLVQRHKPGYQFSRNQKKRKEGGGSEARRSHQVVCRPRAYYHAGQNRKSLVSRQRSNLIIVKVQISTSTALKAPPGTVPEYLMHRSEVGQSLISGSVAGSPSQPHRHTVRSPYRLV
jgi:hypothetical protein